MNSFIVHVSDACGLDTQAAIHVEDSMDIGRAAQLALDAMIEAHGQRIEFPVFVDIHPSAAFQNRAWMHTAAAPQEQSAAQP